MSESDTPWRDELGRESKNRGMKSKSRQGMGEIEGKLARKVMSLSSEKHACPRRGNSNGSQNAVRPLPTPVRWQSFLEGLSVLTCRKE
jgi:hypothetical protein